MGNDSNKKEKDPNEYITFELIQETLGLKNHTLFNQYLQGVFVDLATKNEKSKKNEKLLTRFTFYDYIKLPIFISEKLFDSFAKSPKQEGLTQDEFVNGFFKLYMGNFQETTRVIFNLLDFDKDGIIKKDDVKLILSYLPLNNVNQEKDKNSQSIKEVLGIQMKSLVEIDDIVSNTFKKYENKMKFNQFIDTVQNKKSDVLLQIICFLYQQKPFSAKSIESLESLESSYLQMEDNEYEKMVELYNNKYKKSTTVKIKTPNKLSTLSPAQSFFKRKFSCHGMDLNNDDNMTLRNRSMTFKAEKESTKNLMTFSKSALIVYEEGEFYKDNDINNTSNKDNISIVRLNNDTTLNDKDKIIEKQEDYNNKDNIKQLVDNSKQRYSSPTKYLQEKDKINSLITNQNVENDSENKHNIIQVKEIEKENEKENKENEKEIKEKNENKNNENETESDENQVVNYENWIYKLAENKKLKKFYLELINKDLYYYKDKNKNNLLGMHNLSGCFIHEDPDRIYFEGREFYVFEVFFNNKSKTRKYYTPHIEIMKDFVQNIKKAIGYLKFSDFYELKEVLGKGRFGVVNLAIHKKTQEKVAVKTIKKSKLKTPEAKELVFMEIGILKLCHHPNVIRLLDHLENEDYIFIVTEYVKGDTLENYFKNKKFEFTESEAAFIMIQIANSVKYLHKYGIVHRDLKPDNIMVTLQNNMVLIKIMDFGLSKIISSQEKMVDGYGTITYVAPEVLLRTPYNKEVDIWSMGVILFYMLTGQLPFKGNNYDSIADQIINDDLEFDETEWENRSKLAKQLISNCLIKEPEERITINEFLNHPWFKKYIEHKNSSK